MAHDDKIQMPSSMGGIVRYDSDSHSKFEIRPGTVVIITIAVIVIMIALNMSGLLGL